MPDDLPIAIDLDGTLILDEISHLSFRLFCKQHPFQIWKIPFWLVRGVAYLKSQLASHVTIDPKGLSYNKYVIDFIDANKGRKLILATGADHKCATTVAEFLNCFEGVIASDSVVNSISRIKADRLNAMFGFKQYIYIGNSSQDIAVWNDSAYAIATNAPEKVLKDLKALGVPFEILG